jgi:Fur family transcriptional regulator, ferric uptake regulator
VVLLVLAAVVAHGKGHWELAHPDDAFHLACRSCGEVVHHTGTLVEQMREHLASAHGFEATDIDLVVHGQCARCRG